MLSSAASKKMGLPWSNSSSSGGKKKIPSRGRTSNSHVHSTNRDSNYDKRNMHSSINSDINGNGGGGSNSESNDNNYIGNNNNNSNNNNIHHGNESRNNTHNNTPNTNNTHSTHSSHTHKRATGSGTGGGRLRDHSAIPEVSNITKKHYKLLFTFFRLLSFMFCYLFFFFLIICVSVFCSFINP